MNRHLRFLLLLYIALVSGSDTLRAQSIQVFSRYNYYLPGDHACVVGVLRDSLPSGDYRLVVLREGKELAEADNLSGRMLIAPLDSSGLPPGTTSLPLGTTSLNWQLIKAGRIDTSGTLTIVALPPKPNAVQIDLLTGGLIADHTPFFPFGFYCTPVGDLPEREVVHGFNMIGPYQSNLPATRAERKAYMDRCAQLGVRVQYAVNSLIGSGHNGARGLDMSEADKLALLKEEILAFRDHPALLSWYINDEPDGQGRPPALLDSMYRLIHELDPYHPISIVFMMPPIAGNFRHTMDIAMTDPYPIPGPADKVMNDLAVYNEVFRYEKSVWLVPQAFGGQEMWSREPTAQEIRLMTYMGLVSGVKGIQYYVHAAGNINPQSVSAWSACSDLAVETEQMASFLLSADPAPAVHADDGKVLSRAFRFKDNLLVLAVNNENRPKPMTLSIASSDLNRSAECWFEDRAVPVIGGRIQDIIDGYGTRAYLIRSASAPDSSLFLPGNLTLNPSFEKVVSPGLPVGSNTTHTSRQKADPGATFFTDPLQSKEGLFSLRLVTPVDSGGDKIRLVPIVISKNNSYTVSVWARAKAEEKMPVLRLALDAMKETHSYTLTDRWEKYSFTFNAPASSTNAILSFDLITHGTAWLDLLQVCPDPVIRYDIHPDRSAMVVISSSTDNVQLRYALDKMPDASSPLYHQGFVLKKAATIYAGLFAGNERIAVSQTFVPVNLALGKPVILAIPYDPKYHAAGNGSLTDGIMGTTDFKDHRWLGFDGPDLNATIDLEEAVPVGTVTASFLCDPNDGIFLPPVISVYTSMDGQHFERVGEQRDQTGNPRGEPFLQKVKIRVGRTARYIRVIAKAFGPIPDGYLFKGSTGWVFADEVMVE